MLRGNGIMEQHGMLPDPGKRLVPGFQCQFREGIAIDTDFTLVRLYKSQ